MYPDYNIASMVISYNILTDYLVYRDPYRTGDRRQEYHKEMTIT